LIAALQWQHQWGGQIKHWQFMAERGREPPDAYYERPEIEPHLTWLWNSFWELSTERQIGMAIGPIPVSKIREYLRDEMELTGPEYERARTIIRRVDDAYSAMLNRPRNSGPGMSDSAKVTDPEGIKRVVRGAAVNKRRPK
jgi:hypothetical protein